MSAARMAWVSLKNTSYRMNCSVSLPWMEAVNVPSKTISITCCDVMLRRCCSRCTRASARAVKRYESPPVYGTARTASTNSGRLRPLSIGTAILAAPCRENVLSANRVSNSPSVYCRDSDTTNSINSFSNRLRPIECDASSKNRMSSGQSPTSTVGNAVGSVVGELVDGDDDGAAVGDADGTVVVGLAVGAEVVGAVVAGAADGDCVGCREGVGAAVGAGVSWQHVHRQTEAISVSVSQSARESK